MAVCQQPLLRRLGKRGVIRERHEYKEKEKKWGMEEDSGEEEEKWEVEEEGGKRKLLLRVAHTDLIQNFAKLLLCVFPV